MAEAAIQIRADSAGAVELDPEELWASVIAAGDEALASAGRPHLAAIGLANQGETVMAWDRSTSTPTGPAIVWQDRRAEVVCDRLREHGRFLAEHTGLELDPYFVAPKMAWLRERVGNGPTITTTDTWMLHRLCGAFATDISTAGRSLLLDLDKGEWSDRACEIFGIDIDSLASVARNAQLLGESSVFGGSVPVTGTCVDQQAALFAEHCRAAGEAKCTYGTGAFMLACTGDKPTRSSNGLVGCPAWQIDDTITYCLDGQVYTVGAAVTWLIEMGVMSEPADLDRLGAAVDTTRRRYVRARSRWSRRAVLEASSQGGVHRTDARHRTWSSRARCDRRHRRPGGAACPGRRARSWFSVDSPARRRWADRAAPCCCRSKPTCCKLRSRSTPPPTPRPSVWPRSPIWAPTRPHRPRSAMTTGTQIWLWNRGSGPTRPPSGLLRGSESPQRRWTCEHRRPRRAGIRRCRCRWWRGGLCGRPIALASRCRCCDSRGGTRHRRGHEQGQHCDPSYRLRRHPRIARSPAGRPRL